MNRSRFVALAIVAALIAGFFALGLHRYLTLEFFKQQQASIEAYRAAHAGSAAAIFFLLYVVVTALSLPGALIMTLAGGAIFGLAWGVALSSFAATIGGTLAMLVSRFILRDLVQRRYGDRLKVINDGIARDGAFYLFTLRLVPLFPFFLINVAMGLTPIRVWTFYWVSQLGMLAGTIVYVNAGTQLAQITTLRGIVSPGVLGALALLGLFPLMAKAIVGLVQRRKVYRGHSRPASFDRNLIVIGAGSAGLVTAYIAAAVKAKVTLIEKHKMGGDCLNTGCVPSKALLRSAKLLDHARRAPEFGIRELRADVDFSEVMARVQRVVQRVEPHDSVERYTDLGVEVLQGEARLTTPWAVEIREPGGSTRTLTARDVVIATGAEPFVPPIPGLKDIGYLTSDTVWDLRRRPDRLVVLGGGPIGCELAQAFARLGCKVTQVEMLPRLLPREDAEISAMVMKRFLAEGIDVRVGTKAAGVIQEGAEKILVCEAAGERHHVPFDEILVAVGRAARLKGFGLEELGVEVGKTIQVNGFLQTNFPNIYACGDVAGPYQFTHTASHMAWYCAVNTLFAPLLPLRGGKFKVDYSAIPWATFTEPEVARVGLNELEAREKNIPYEVATFDLEELDRAIADGEAHGVIKVLTVPGKDRILGVTIAGEHAGDVIAEYVLAMRHGIGLNKILGTIHIYPTLAEMNKYVAGQWKQAHKPERVLRVLEKFHAWRRG